jgi:fermentation-respiration switch protein FrsA (DUF1100 family)
MEPGTWSWSATRWAARSLRSSWSARPSLPASPVSCSTPRRWTGRRSSPSTRPRWASPSFGALPVEWAIGARIDADWESLDALQHNSDFQLPILLFHGTEDDVVPISTSDDFAEELPRRVTYFRVAEAGHTEEWNVDPPLYERRLGAFLNRVAP